MERGLRDLEEEIQMLKSNGALSTEEREEEMKQMEVYRSHSKFMKNKVMACDAQFFFKELVIMIHLYFLRDNKELYFEFLLERKLPTKTNRSYHSLTFFIFCEVIR